MTMFLTGYTAEQLSKDSVDEITDTAMENLGLFFSVGFLEHLEQWLETLSSILKVDVDLVKRILRQRVM